MHLASRHLTLVVVAVAPGQGELAVVDRAPTSASYARVDFHPECEAAINEQIK